MSTDNDNHQLNNSRSKSLNPFGDTESDDSLENIDEKIEVPNVEGRHVFKMHPGNPFDNYTDEDDEEIKDASDKYSFIANSNSYSNENIRKKRHAPLPPNTVPSLLPTCKLTHSHKSGDSNGSNQSLPFLNNLQSDRNQESRHSYKTVDAEAHVSSRNPFELPASRKLSMSCDDAIDKKCLTSAYKRPAPPLPVPEKRLVRAENLYTPIDCSSISSQISELESLLTQLNTCIENLSMKIKKVDKNGLKFRKYTKKHTKLLAQQAHYLERKRRLTSLIERKHLEDQHSDLEHELRTLLAKQNHLRTDAEKARERDLLRLLVDIVQKRDELVSDDIPDTSVVVEQKNHKINAANIFKFHSLTIRNSKPFT